MGVSELKVVVVLKEIHVQKQINIIVKIGIIGLKLRNKMDGRDFNTGT